MTNDIFLKNNFPLGVPESGDRDMSITHIASKINVCAVALALVQ